MKAAQLNHRLLDQLHNNGNGDESTHGSSPDLFEKFELLPDDFEDTKGGEGDADSIFSCEEERAAAADEIAKRNEPSESKEAQSQSQPADTEA